MKKTYIKPETLVVAVNVKEHLMEPSVLVPDTPANSGSSGVDDITGNTLAREVLISDETTTIARGAWEKW